MRTANIGRRTAAGVVAVALGTAGLVVVPDGAAQAGGVAPVRVEEVDDSDSTTKIVVAECTETMGSVFAAGARVVNGNGGVVLTAMVPNPELTSVTVTATARTGYEGDWSLMAFAICDRSGTPPVRRAATVESASTAEVDCPDDTRLVGTGFRFEGSVDQTYVDEVAFGSGLGGVRVHTGGVAPESLTAFGVCKEPTQMTGQPGARVEASSAHDGTWPKTAATDDPNPDQHVYGIGASVVGSGGFFLSALVPSLNLRLAGAEAVEASQLPGAAVATTGAGRAGVADADADGDADADADDDADGDGSVTVSGLLMAAFH
ncbi:hypothetical protein I0C86_02655 [Plantactinospora sp. S1510]|uniref:Secreted protein n=1 Tax=Plantactinospora alkalitolerans TaxID=2789879 RepID=A0ABS0GPA5_9ACTN|nr:hypothetical protein [Plantactinospora alkalitolerans]MBF9127904.1 hypothetical protein [Plantactinospora alkalitolerans]